MSSPTHKKSYPQSIHLGESRGCNSLAVCYNARMLIEFLFYIVIVLSLVPFAFLLWEVFDS